MFRYVQVVHHLESFYLNDDTRWTFRFRRRREHRKCILLLRLRQAKHVQIIGRFFLIFIG